MTSNHITIEGMTRGGTLSGISGAYSYAALLVAGPWIFTVIGLFGLSATACDGICSDQTVFRSIVIYNSMYALIVTSPLAFLSGRYVSEQVRCQRDEHVLHALVLSLGFFALLSLAIAVPFYVFMTTLNPAEKIAGIQNVAMIGCSWLLIPFLGSTRAYNTVLIAFGLGTLALLGVSSALHGHSALSLLLTFNSGIAVTNVILLSAIVRRFGTEFVLDPGLGESLIRKWELPAAGIAYGLGLWIDKIIMWYFAPRGGLLVAGALQTMPSYDTAMFWSQLSSIPVLAIFFVHVETRFTGLVRTVHERIEQRASRSELDELTAAIGIYVVSSIFRLFVALVTVAAMMILLSFVFMPKLGLLPDYMSILRVSLWSMAFYTGAMFCFSLLLHLDLRRQALQIVVTYLVLNAGLTAALLPLGPAFYGYGNMIAATLSLLAGFGLVLRELPWLHYHAFVTNNPSV